MLAHSIEVTNERHLYKALKQIFPGERISTNVTKQHTIRYTDTGNLLEFDAWLPDLLLCFEFQDQYHYKPTHYTQRALDEIQFRDDMKKQIIFQKEISLVVVPCWWEGDLHSLASTIQFRRPDLLVDHDTVLPVPLNPFLHFFPDNEIPAAGQLMLAVFVDEHFVPSPEWWIGEKYDGVRCYWHSLERSFYSRYGRYIHLTKAVARRMPKLGLDMEIWFGRNQFACAFATVNRSVIYFLESLRLIVFDLASLKERQYEERYFDLMSQVLTDHPCLIPAFRMQCVDEAHVEEMMHCVTKHEGEGEGLMFQRTKSLYENGKSVALLKMKTVSGDQEAIVEAIKTDGSLTLKLPNNTRFGVPFQDVHVSRPSIGDIVTFSYKDHTRREHPIHPVVTRVRHDLVWNNVVSQPNTPHQSVSYWAFQKARKHLVAFVTAMNMDPLLPSTWYQFHASSLPQLKTVRKILRQYKGSYRQAIQAIFPEISFEKSKFRAQVRLEKHVRRQYFIDFATKHGFDPLIADNWYKFAYNDFAKFKKLNSIVRRHHYSISKSLAHCFPEISFDVAKFAATPRSFWSSTKNRRMLLEKCARSLGGNPLLPKFWYKLQLGKLRKFKGVKRIIDYYEDYKDAIVSLFPELRLNRAKFSYTVPSWKEETKRKEFFDNFAASKGVDPLLPSSWYKVTANEVIHYNLAYKAIVKYHGTKLSDCLMQLYPNIGLQLSAFDNRLRWGSFVDRKEVLLRFASAHCFDPLVASNWYPFTFLDFSSFPGARSMLGYYDLRYSAAIMDLFPNINIDPAKFSNIPLRYWQEVKNRRELFCEIARSRGFDPLIASNWYPVTYTSLENVKSALSVLQHYYKGSVARAIVDVFPDIGVEEGKFKGRGEWEYSENRKWYLQTVAAKYEFNPLSFSDWCSFLDNLFGKKTSRLAKTLKSIFSNYKTTEEALVSIFPAMNKDKSSYL